MKTRLTVLLYLALITTRVASAREEQEYRYDPARSTWVVRTTHTDGSQTFENVDHGPVTPQSATTNVCTSFGPYAPIFPPVSWLDTVRFFERQGKARLSITTTFYFDAPNDYHLFVLEYNTSTSVWVQVYASDYGSTANRNGNAIGDLNGDMLPDIVVGHGNGITVFLDNGAGGYIRQQVQIGDAADVLAIADVDGDSKLDVISIPWADSITVRYGNGSGGFSRSATRPDTIAGYDDLNTGDVDGDGRKELLVMSGQGLGPNLTVRELAPTLPVASVLTIGARELTSSVTAADITGDGLEDVVLSRPDNVPTYLWYYKQVGGMLPGPPGRYLSADIPEPLEAEDLDCDGRKEIVTAHGGWNLLGVYKNLGMLGLDTEELCPLPYASHYRPRGGLAVGDGNGDMRPDVYVADYNNGILELRGATSACCVIGPPPAQLWATKSGPGRGSVTFSWGPASIAAASIVRVGTKQDIPALPGAVEVCTGASPGCTAAGEVGMAPRTAYYQTAGACK